MAFLLVCSLHLYSDIIVYRLCIDHPYIGHSLQFPANNQTDEDNDVIDTSNRHHRYTKYNGHPSTHNCKIYLRNNHLNTVCICCVLLTPYSGAMLLCISHWPWAGIHPHIPSNCHLSRIWDKYGDPIHNMNPLSDDIHSYKLHNGSIPLSHSWGYHRCHYSVERVTYNWSNLNVCTISIP